MDRDHLLPCVIVGQGTGHLLGGQAQSGQIQWDHRLHTGVVIGHHRHESRRGSQAGDGGHLRQVLVVQRQPVGAGRVQRGVGTLGFILGNHLFAAARVAGQAGAVQQRGLGHQAQFHQRGHRSNKAGGVAAGHGYAGGGFQRLAGIVQFRQTIGPAGSRAVCGGGIQHADIGPQQRHHLAGGIVRQAEEREVTLIDHRRAGVYVLAFGLGNMQNRELRPFGQTVRNAQPGCTGTAVNKDFILSHFYTPIM